MEIIYIAGDGRSGSTLLDSILSNIENSISVGEAYRFWVRFYEGETDCGCRNPIQNCKLWRQLDETLKFEFSNYDPRSFWAKVQEIQFYRNFERMPQLLQEDDWPEFAVIVKRFYELISEITGKDVIIDSSKSIPWARLLQVLSFADLKIIHLERDLVSVANSWKKRVQLPEYKDKEVFMPVKSNSLIVKSWLKIRWKGRKLKNYSSYLFVPYRELTARPIDVLGKIQEFLQVSFDAKDLRVHLNHAIGGNPMRNQLDSRIEIRSEDKDRKNLNLVERMGFSMIHRLSKIFFR